MHQPEFESGSGVVIKRIKVPELLSNDLCPAYFLPSCPIKKHGLFCR